jgi:DNA-binding NarL/FixJ family response regulator
METCMVHSAVTNRRALAQQAALRPTAPARVPGGQGRGPAPSDRPARIGLLDQDPNSQRTVQEAFPSLASAWQLECHALSEEAVKRLAVDPPAAVLLGCRYPRNSGLDYLVMLATSLPDLRIIMFAESARSDETLSALAAGAAGYVLKTTPPRQLVCAVREVLREGAFLCQEAKRAVLEFFHGNVTGGGKFKLTPREREVCILLLKHRKKEVALKLNLATKTVDTLAQRAFKKLGIHSRGALFRALVRRR